MGSFALLVMHNLGHLGAPSAIVEDVVVAPALQRHGIGKAMMQFALERCRDKGCYKLMLSSNAKRERAMHSTNRSDSCVTVSAFASTSRSPDHDAAERRSTAPARRGPEQMVRATSSAAATSRLPSIEAR